LLLGLVSLHLQMLDSSHVIFAQSSFCPEPSLPITENIAQAFFDFRNVSGI
jgi:hypothetical protein